jgi:hypothetical protein
MNEVNPQDPRDNYNTLKLPAQTSLHNLPDFKQLGSKVCDMVYTEERAQVNLIFPYIQALHTSKPSTLNNFGQNQYNQNMQGNIPINQVTLQNMSRSGQVQMPIPHTNLNFNPTKNSRTKSNAQRFLSKFKSRAPSQNTYQPVPGKRQNDSSLKSPKVCYYNSAKCLCQLEMPQNPRWLTLMRNKANMPNYNSGKGSWELRKKSYVHIVGNSTNFMKSGETVIGLDCDRDSQERHKMDIVTKRMKDTKISEAHPIMQDELRQEPEYNQMMSPGAFSNAYSTSSTLTGAISIPQPLRNLTKFSNGFSLFRDQDKSVYLVYPFDVKTGNTSNAPSRGGSEFGSQSTIGSTSTYGPGDYNHSQAPVYIQSEFIIESLQPYTLVEVNPSWAIKIFDYPELDKKLRISYEKIEKEQKETNMTQPQYPTFQNRFGNYCGAKICFEPITMNRPAENHPIWLSLMWDEGQDLIDKYKLKMRAVEVNFIDSRSS